LKLLRTGDYLFVVGAVVGVLGLLTLLIAGQGLMTGATEALLPGIIGLILTFFGGLAFTVGAFLVVLVPAANPQLASQGYGGHIAILSALAVAVIVSNLLVLIIMMLSMLGIAPWIPTLMDGDMITIAGLVASAITLQAAMLLIVYYRIVRTNVITFSQMGLTWDSLWRKIGIGVAAGVGIIVVSSILELVLRQLGVMQTQMEMFAPVQQAPIPQFLVLAVVVAVFAPIAEEIFFRGYVFSAYRNQKGLWQAFLFSSVIFAVVHLNLPAVVPLFVVGIALAGVYYITGSLVSCMVAHGVNNAVGILLLYLSR
jgi:membrane protease YdiL (CAAX protease family)